MNLTLQYNTVLYSSTEYCTVLGTTSPTSFSLSLFFFNGKIISHPVPSAKNAKMTGLPSTHRRRTYSVIYMYMYSTESTTTSHPNGKTRVMVARTCGFANGARVALQEETPREKTRMQKRKVQGTEKMKRRGGGKKGHNEEREKKKKGLRNLPSLITDPKLLQCCTGMTIIQLHFPSRFAFFRFPSMLT